MWFCTFLVTTYSKFYIVFSTYSSCLLSSASWLSIHITWHWRHQPIKDTQGILHKSTLVYYQFRFGFIYFITSIYLIRRSIDFCCQHYHFQDKVSQMYGTVVGPLVYQWNGSHNMFCIVLPSSIKHLKSQTNLLRFLFSFQSFLFWQVILYHTAKP